VTGSVGLLACLARWAASTREAASCCSAAGAAVEAGYLLAHLNRHDQDERLLTGRAGGGRPRVSR
jgi:hypothetical protein